MGSIRDINNEARRQGLPTTQWRDDLLPARFRLAMFHVESGSKQSGRRIVLHQFPKKDLPYAEDMGREAKAFTIRGYTICYPYDAGIPLYSRDYRIARDILVDNLERSGPGALQLPTFPKSPLYVVCQGFRITEEERFGGFAIFDMQFVEFGYAPSRTQPDDPTYRLQQESEALRQTVLTVLSQKHSPVMGRLKGIQPPAFPGPLRLGRR